MKYLLYSIPFTILLSCSSPQEESSVFVEDEVIASVLMKANENKSSEEIADFSDFYTNMVEDVQFLDHFQIIEIDVYGNVSDEHKSIINSFNFPTSYNSEVAKYSRN